MRLFLYLFCICFIKKAMISVWSGSDPGFGQGGGPQVLRPKVADIAKRAICGRGPGPA